MQQQNVVDIDRTSVTALCGVFYSAAFGVLCQLVTFYRYIDVECSTVLCFMVGMYPTIRIIFCWFNDVERSKRAMLNRHSSRQKYNSRVHILSRKFYRIQNRLDAVWKGIICLVTSTTKICANRKYETTKMPKFLFLLANDRSWSIYKLTEV